MFGIGKYGISKWAADHRFKTSTSVILVVTILFLFATRQCGAKFDRATNMLGFIFMN